MVPWLKENYPKYDRKTLVTMIKETFGEDVKPNQITSFCNYYNIKSTRFFHTEEELDWLRENYPKYDRNTLAPIFNKQFNRNITPSTLSTLCSDYKIKSGRTGYFKKKYPKEYIDWLQEHSTESIKTLLPIFNKHFNTNLGYYALRGLMYNYVIRPETYNPNEFRKNNKRAPVNKERNTQFGVLVKTAKRIYNSTYNCADGTKPIWEYKHRQIWEQHYGPIPKDHIVIFLDGNKKNCDISNLQCIPRSIHGPMCLNNFYNHSKEITQAGIEILQTEKLIKEEYDNA